MSRTVDEHVVEMRFNNSDFEKKTAQTMSTLDKLKEKLNFSTNTKAIDDTANSLNNLNKINFNGLSDSVKVLDMSLSAIAKNTIFTELTEGAIKAGKTIVNSLTKPMQQVVTGGKRRAQNIENAKFQLRGLGIEWAQIKDDLDYGVKDTAYGLDSAAKAAAQFVASGVELGDEMQTALRAISGVAAMTNSSYDEIANIFTAVSGQGKLMTMQMNQLAMRGLNVASTLAKAMNMTEAELRENVTKGKVSFKEFADAMDEAYGEHAKKANDTFNGALSNVNAALSRTGANVAAAGYEGLRVVLVKLIDIVNLFNKQMAPLIGEGKALANVINYISSIAATFVEYLTEKLNSSGLAAWAEYTGQRLELFFNKLYFGFKELKEEGGLDKLFNALADAAYNLTRPIRFLAQELGNIIPKPTVKNVSKLIEKFIDFTKKMRLSNEAIGGLKKTIHGIVYIFGKFLDVVRKVLSYTDDLIIGLKNIVEKILEFVNDPNAAKNSILEKIFNSRIVKLIKEVIPNAIKNLIPLIESIGSKIADIWSSFKNTSAYKGIVGFFESVFDKVTGVVEKTFGHIGEFTSLKDYIGNIDATKVAEKISGAFEKISNFLQPVKDFFSLFTSGKKEVEETKKVVDDLGYTIETITKYDEKRNAGRGNPITDSLTGSVSTFAKATETIKSSVASIKAFITEYIKTLDIGKLITEAYGIAIVTMIFNFAKAAKKMGGLSDSLKDFFDTITGKISIKKQLNLSPVMQLLAALVVVVLSIVALGLLYENYQAGFNAAVKVLAIIAIVIAATALLAKKMKEFPTGAFKCARTVMQFCKALTLVAFSLGGLALAFSNSKPLAVVLALASIVGIVGLLIITLKELQKMPEAGTPLKTLASLLTIIFALKMVMVSLLALTLMYKIAPDETRLAVMSILAILLMFSSVGDKLQKTGENAKLSAKVIIKTGVTILSIALALLAVAKALSLLSGIELDKSFIAKTGILVVTLLAFTGIAYAIAKKLEKNKVDTSKVMKIFLGIGAVVLALGILVKILSSTKWDGDQVLAVLEIMLAMIVVVMAMTMVSDVIANSKESADYGKVTAVFAAIASTMLAMSIVFAILQKVTSSDQEIGTALSVMIGIALGLVAVAAAIGQLAKGDIDWKSVLSIVGGIALLIVLATSSLMVLANAPTDALLTSALSLAAIMVAMAAAIWAITQIKIDDTKKIWSIIGLLAGIGIVVGILGLLITAMAQLDVTALLVASGVILVSLLALYAVVEGLSKIDKVKSSVIVTLGVLAVVLLAFGASMLMVAFALSKVAEAASNGYALAAMITIMAEMAIIIGIIMLGMAAVGKAGAEASAPLLSFAVAMITVALAVGAVALVIWGVAAIIGAVALYVKVLADLFIYLIENCQKVGPALLTLEAALLVFLRQLAADANEFGKLGAEIGVEFVGGFIEGIFTALADVMPKILDAMKKYWKEGWKTLFKKETDVDVDEVADTAKTAANVGKGITSIFNKSGKESGTSFTDSLKTSMKSGMGGLFDGIGDDLQNQLNGQSFNMDIVPSVDSLDLSSISSNIGIDGLTTGMDTTNSNLSTLNQNVQTGNDEANRIAEEGNKVLSNIQTTMDGLKTEVSNLKITVGNLRLVMDGTNFIATVDRENGKSYSRNSRQSLYNGKQPTIRRAYS